MLGVQSKTTRPQVLSAMIRHGKDPVNLSHSRPIDDLTLVLSLLDPGQQAYGEIG
jgi:hypothetical protein